MNAPKLFSAGRAVLIVVVLVGATIAVAAQSSPANDDQSWTARVAGEDGRWKCLEPNQRRSPFAPWFRRKNVSPVSQVIINEMNADGRSHQYVGDLLS
jgi:hypothetical protein